MTRLRNKLIVLFLVATLAPLGITLWITTSLIEASLSYASTEELDEISQSLEQIMRIQSHKTGALFRFACEAGAILAGTDRAPLRQYADNIGLAFQITDDLLDLDSTPEELGKATQKDKVRGKATIASLMGRDAARQKAESLVQSAIAVLEPYGSAADTLRGAARFIIVRKK